MIAVAYYEDVEFLKEAAPGLVTRNADEFRRMHNLLESVKPSVRRAKDEIRWQGAGREQYDARLDDVSGLVDALSTAFAKAGKALDDYAPKLGEAQRLMREGKVTEQKLADEIGKVATAITRTAQEAEPLRRWEDIRATTGILDWIAELGMDVDSIRENAERFYEQTKSSFEKARTTEERARHTCLAGLKAGFDALPDFRANAKDAAAIIAGVSEVAKEATEARGEQNVALPGSGPKSEVQAFDPNGKVSPTLERFQEIAAGLPEGTNTSYFLSENSDEFRKQWIQDNKAAINAAAEEAGLPPELVAGIAWQEVGGKGRVWDDLAQTGRDIADADWFPVTSENLPGRLGGSPDDVSYGPLSIQTRRAAEVLGYDPENLTDEQRDEIRAAAEDPRTNVLISAQHLADLKAQTEYADIPPEQMTEQQRSAMYAEIGARYNGGPNWNTDPNAEAYGQTLLQHLPEAREAMQ